MNTPFRRRIVIIKKSLQLKYVALVFFSVLVAMLIIVWDIYYGIARVIMKEIGPEVYPLLIKVNATMLIKLIGFLIIVGIVAIFVSHRFAGPIYRFEKTAELIARGDLTTEIHLRRNDELKDLAQTLNYMNKQLRNKIKGERELITELQHRVYQLTQQLATTNPDLKTRDFIVKELTEIQSKLTPLLTQFKV